MEWPRQREGELKNSFKQSVNCASIYHTAGTGRGGGEWGREGEVEL